MVIGAKRKGRAGTATRAGTALAALLLALSACAPPVRTAATPGASRFPTPAANAIFVSRGENLYTIAQRYNVPLNELIQVNGLQPPYTIHPGQRLILPVPREHKVVEGDTIYGISRQYGVDMTALVRMNGIQAPYLIRTGQVLRLPGFTAPPGATQTAQTVPRVVETNPAPPPSSAPRPSVQKVEVESLPPLEGNRPVDNSIPGSRPVGGSIPVRPAGTIGHSPAGTGAPMDTAPQALPPMPPARTVPGQTAPATAVTTTPGPTTPITGPTTQVPQTQVPQTQTAAALPPPPPPRTGRRFAWPVRGSILSGFGEKPGGLYNDGLNIAAAAGTPVQAAESGSVIYAGNELKGYGNLILIRHADGWLTAYAHLDSMEVERGASVTRGQRIGTVGRTGNVRSPQLHFGIRQNDKAVDPQKHLDG